MRLFQSEIACLYLHAFALGALLGLSFDLIRFPRMLFSGTEKPIKKRAKVNFFKRRIPGVFVFLEDFLFCIVGSVCSVLLFYEYNRGKIRPFAFILLLTAFFVYHITVGKWVRAFLQIFASWVQKAIRKVCALLWKPIRNLLQVIWKFVKQVWNTLQKGIEKRARQRNTKRLFGIVERNAAGLLPGGYVLPKQKKIKAKERRVHGRKRKEDHCPKQKSVA